MECLQVVVAVNGVFIYFGIFYFSEIWIAVDPKSSIQVRFHVWRWPLSVSSEGSLVEKKLDSDHAVSTALSAGRAWRFNLDCRCDVEEIDIRNGHHYFQNRSHAAAAATATNYYYYRHRLYNSEGRLCNTACWPLIGTSLGASYIASL